MHWFTLAVFATLCWALVNNLDKIVISRFVKSPLGIVVIEGFVGFITALFFLPRVSLLSIPLNVMFLGILSGFLLYIFNYLYYKALAKSDPTIIAILIQMVPLFTFVWGILFFNETFSTSVYFGAVCIVTGSVLASLENSVQGSNNSNPPGKAKYVRIALLIMVPANMLLSVNYAIQKYALQFTDDESVYVLARIGGLLFSFCFLLFPTVRTSIKQYAVVSKLKEWSFFLFIELFNLGGIFLVTAAYATGPIALVTTVTSIQPVFVAILGIIIGTFFLRRANALSTGLEGYRIPAIILIAIGAYLLNS